jgi:hypothetical protein
VERLADISGEAEGLVWLLDAVDRSRLAVHLDSAALQAQDRPRRRIATGAVGRRVLRVRVGAQAGRSCETSHYEGAARQHHDVSMAGVPANSHGFEPVRKKTDTHQSVEYGGILTGWVEENLDETLTFYRLPRQHHKHLKSTNMLERLNEEIKRERLNEEIKRRTHVVRIFPNAESCLRLVRALAVDPKARHRQCTSWRRFVIRTT